MSDDNPIIGIGSVYTISTAPRPAPKGKKIKMGFAPARKGRKR